MYEQSLPGAAGSIDGARAWIRSIALEHHPELSDDAERAVGEQVAIAIRRTPLGDTIHLTATPTAEGLVIEVRDPGHPLTGQDGAEWAELSSVAHSFRATRTAEGHLTEVELRSRQAVAS